MQSLKKFFLRVAESEIRHTRWFKTAPLNAQADATFSSVGLQDRVFHSLSSSTTQPAIIAECPCGQRVGRFSLLLGDLGDAALIDEHQAN